MKLLRELTDVELIAEWHHWDKEIKTAAPGSRLLSDAGWSRQYVERQMGLRGLSKPTSQRSGDGAGEILMLLYHVTPTKSVPSIKRKGLLHFMPSNWIRRSGERFGRGEIYACDSLHDALRWAAKIDWDLNQETGSGKVSIVEFEAGPNPWEVDDSDPISQAGNQGKWLKSHYSVGANQIIVAVPVDRDRLAVLRP